MPELVLPAPLKEDDITCVVKTAGSLGLETQMVCLMQLQRHILV